MRIPIPHAERLLIFEANAKAGAELFGGSLKTE